MIAARGEPSGASGRVEIPIGAEEELCFEAMGTEIRVLVGPATRADLPSPVEAARMLRTSIEHFDRELSRFRPDSELSRLNDHSGGRFRGSPLLLRLLGAGLRAAQLTGGLADPTLLGEIARAGYGASRPRTSEPLLPRALALAPPRSPARPRPDGRWRGFELDQERGVVTREPGLGFDSGGVGKGLAADLACEQLDGYQRFLVDCGGDIRVGGFGARLDPYEILIGHPLDRGAHRRARLSEGAIATSGIDGRIWRRGDAYGHHLLDPSTGEPAWTGVISATALAPTAVEAEALAKAALLAGPAGARGFLAAYGGVFVRDDGSCRVIRRNLPAEITPDRSAA
jgi:thiamine biosynthesis lipoprotein